MFAPYIIFDPRTGCDRFHVRTALLARLVCWILPTLDYEKE